MAKPAPSTSHPVIATLVVLLWVAGVYFADGWFGLSSTPHGWLWLALAYAVGFLFAAQLLDNGLVAIFGLVLALGLGYADYRTSPATADELVSMADRVPVPPGWSVVRSEPSGNPWCIAGCPELTRTYSIQGDYAAERTRLVEAMAKDGWKSDSRGDSDAHLTKGRWEAFVDGVTAGGARRVVIRFAH